MISIPYILYFCFLIVIHINYGRYFDSDLECTNDDIKIKNKIIIIVHISFLVFFGLRGYIYTDCFQYKECFDNISLYMDDLSSINYRFEPGYVILNYLISLITSDFFVFQFIWTAIDLIFIHIILKREIPRYYLLAFALLVPFWMGIQMNLFRNEKVILVFFLLLSYMKDNKIIPFILCILLCQFLHSSALLFIPVFFVIRNESLKFWLSVCAISIIFYCIGLYGVFDELNQIASLVSNRYEMKVSSYTDDFEDRGFSLGLIFRIILMITYLYYYKDLVIKNKLLTNISILYLCSNTAFNSVLVFRDRLSSMFVMGIICTLPNLMELIKTSNYGFILNWFIKINVLAYVFIQTNSPAAYYENVIWDNPNVDRAIERVNKSEK